MTGRVAIIRTAAPVVAALVAVLVPAAAQAGETNRSAERLADGARAAGWTSWIDADLSARRLGLSASAPAPALARAALRRNAERLGLGRSLPGVRLVRQLEAPARVGARAVRQLRFRQQAGRLRVVWSQIDVTVTAGKVRSIAATVVPVRRGPAAGAVLHTVPQRLSPRPTFDEVRRAFTQSARALYGGLAAQDAIEAFIAVGLVPPPPEEPDCGPEAC